MSFVYVIFNTYGDYEKHKIIHSFLPSETSEEEMEKIITILNEQKGNEDGYMNYQYQKVQLYK